MNFRFMTIEDEIKLLQQAEEIVNKTKSVSGENICVHDNNDNDVDPELNSDIQTHTIPPHSLSEKIEGKGQLNETGKTVVERDGIKSTSHMPLDGQTGTSCQNFDNKYQHEEVLNIVLPLNGGESNLNTQQIEQNQNLACTLSQSISSPSDGIESNSNNTRQIDQNQNLDGTHSLSITSPLNGSESHLNTQQIEQHPNLNQNQDGTLSLSITSPSNGSESNLNNTQQIEQNPNLNQNLDGTLSHSITSPSNGSESNLNNTQQIEQNQNLDVILSQSITSPSNGSESNVNNTQQIEQNQNLDGTLSQSIDLLSTRKMDITSNHHEVEGTKVERKVYSNCQHGSLVMDIEYYSH